MVLCIRTVSKKGRRNDIGSHDEGVFAFLLRLSRTIGNGKVCRCCGMAGEKKRGDANATSQKKRMGGRKEREPPARSRPNRRGRKKRHTKQNTRAQRIEGKRDRKKQTSWVADYFFFCVWCVPSMAARATIVRSPVSCRISACRARCEKKKNERWEERDLAGLPATHKPEPFFPSFFVL